MTQTETAAQAEDTFVLELTHRFEAPREAVFRAWTDPEAFAQWMGPEAVSARDVKMDARVGGAYSLTMEGPDGGTNPLSGIYREVDPPSRLVFTFVWGHGELKDVEMLVTLAFAEDKGGTLMTLLQERIPSESARDHHSQGWTGSFTCLERHLAA